MKLFSIFLALVAVFVGGFILGMWCVICTIEKHYQTAWKFLRIEMQLDDRDRAKKRRKEV